MSSQPSPFPHRRTWSIPACVLALVAGTALCAPALAQPEEGGEAAAARGGKEAPEFPPFTDVAKNYVKVVSTADGSQSLYTLYKREKDQKIIAELPRDFERQRIFIATTFAGGVPGSGIQVGETYAYWRRYDKRMALMLPNTDVKAGGAPEYKTTEKRLYTDRVLLDLPIIAMGPNGGPVIEVNEWLVGNGEKFFGGQAAGARKHLLKIAKAKAFPKNLELAFEMPMREGTLMTLYYSISLIEGSRDYKPRLADPRVGYFTTSYRDISKQDTDSQWVRYINRWNLQKRDPKLALSPPKEPIVFYIDAATPIAYRRWVKEGLLAWNPVFEKVGIVDAIQVIQQDPSNPETMDKDPEDVRYNFIRWTSADLGFAIGPSRVNPETGEILDADIVIDDGFIRGWFRQYNELIPETAMLAYGPDVLSWLEDKPEWDPRVRMASPAEREVLLQKRLFDRAKAAAEIAEAAQDGRPFDAPVMSLRSGEPLMFGTTPTVASPALAQRYHGRCSAMLGKAVDVEMMRTSMGVLGLITEDPEGDESGEAPAKPEKGKKPKVAMIDGLPEWFVGPLLKDLVMHESGHTLGLRHNFKASSIATVEQMNTEDFKGKKTVTGSVMDYSPLNINYKDGPVQGDFVMVMPGPYDEWVIEYGYTMESDLKPILARVSEADLPYATDEDISGPDPYAKQFDLGKDSLAYCDSTMRLVQHLRPKILDKIVKDGDSWEKARRAYLMLLSQQVRAVRIAAWHIGGANVNRDRKGDPGDRVPITPTDMAQQRRALKFIIENCFRDEAFGLNRDLLARITIDKWYDGGGMANLFQDPAWPIHDRILGVQASALTMLLNPVTMQRVYDNEFRVDPSQDCLTLPEVLDAVIGEVFSEVSSLKSGTAREPSISSLRRNLQRETLNRLIDLTMEGAGLTAAYKPVTNLVVWRLRELQKTIDRAKENSSADPYTRAHLTEASIRIAKALDAQYVYNQRSGGGMFFPMMFGAPVPTHTPPSGEPRDESDR